MVTQNQTSATTIVLLATVLLLTFVPFSHSIPYVFADKQGLSSGFSHVTTSLAFASHKHGLFTGFGHATTSTQGQAWNQDPQQHNKDSYKNWHHHGSNGDGQTNYIKNNQHADCSSTSTASGGNANGGGGGTSNGGTGGSSPGGKGGDSNGGSGGDSSGGNGGASPGGNGGDSSGGNGATAGSGGIGGPSIGGPGGDAHGGTAGTGGPGAAGSQTACSNTSTFNISNAA
ncbi:MAG: hypothetical protein M3044_12465 [Thermoproteota archaeon]|nr:hypothetical protein [Thermoproteota archaeon]